MTEDQWLKCTNVNKLLTFLKSKGYELSKRKLRLLMCAYARTKWNYLNSDSKYQVEIAERYADNKVSKSDLIKAKSFNDLIGLPLSRERISALIANYCLYDIRLNAMYFPYKADRYIQCNLVRELFISPFWINQTICTRCNGKGDHRLVDISTKSIGFNSYECDICRGKGRVNVHWLNPRIIDFTKLIYKDRDFKSIPILGDMLEDYGCIDKSILDHCHLTNQHALGCWVLDFILGKI